MSLVRCDTPGSPRIVDAEPFVETPRDALFVPAAGAWADRGWGVYDAADRLVVAAARWTGAGPACWTASDDAIAASRPPAEPDRVRVYAGNLEAHDFFFRDTLARFWGRATSGAGGVRLVFDARAPLERFWEAPHAAEALAAFGVGPLDGLVPVQLLRIPHLLVPAFIAGRLAYRAFGPPAPSRPGTCPAAWPPRRQAGWEPRSPVRRPASRPRKVLPPPCSAASSPATRSCAPLGSSGPGGRWIGEWSSR